MAMGCRYGSIRALALTGWIACVSASAGAQPPPEQKAASPLDAGASSSSDADADLAEPHLREMSTDRPDTTESPITVDAGRFQVEVEAVSMTRDEGVTATALAALNLKLGLTAWSDLQLIVEPFRHVEDQSGVGEVAVRNKINFWGDDGGPTAFALMPFVTLPTGGLGADHLEGGLIAPLAFEGPMGWELATMLEVDAVWRGSYGADLVATITSGHAIVGDLAEFLELASSIPLDSDLPAAIQTNAGLTFAVNEDLVFDTGVRVGLNDAAEDFSFFVGGSTRY
jgi:outer membrane putative beta-barrel porin/alpha-amylase